MESNYQPEIVANQQTKAITQGFALTWRNKYLTCDATTIEEMIALLQQNVDNLKNMQAAGVTLDFNCDMGNDYARLITSNPQVAQQFGFELDWVDEEDGSEQENNLGAHI